MEIVKAKSSDIVEIMYFVDVNFKESLNISLIKWINNLSLIEQFVNEESAYILKEKNITKAIFIISNKMPDDYNALNVPQNNTLFVNLLLVHPLYKNHGIYNNIFSFIEDFAKSNNYKHIILDTISTNENLYSFLQIKNFTKTGTFYISLQKIPFYYFTKQLN